LAKPEEGPQGPDVGDNHLLGVGGLAQKFEIQTPYFDNNYFLEHLFGN